jgi:hypothetical protein
MLGANDVLALYVAALWVPVLLLGVSGRRWRSVRRDKRA